MKILRSIVLLLFSACLLQPAFAGNPERIGQAGATQLLINPYARSSALNGLNPSYTRGIESVITNVAGIAHGRGTEVVFNHTVWLQGSGVRINNMGLNQQIGELSNLGVSIMAFDFGDIERTTIDNPDGGVGTYSPTLLNASVSYGREMVEDQIFVGATAKLVHSSIPDVSSSGVAFDAGVQYWAPNSNFKMGVALRNVGPQVQPGGDGLTVRTQLSGPGSGFDNAVSLKSAAYEMPSVLMIGASYDLKFGGSDSTDHLHRITPTAAFRYRSFHPDQYGAGIEYAFRNYLILRVSHFFEQDIYSDQSRNAFTGLAAGVTLQLPFGENDNIIGVDYSYRPTRYFSGTHTFGLHLNL